MGSNRHSNAVNDQSVAKKKHHIIDVKYSHDDERRIHSIIFTIRLITYSAVF
jgi:hypothetical protein